MSPAYNYKQNKTPLTATRAKKMFWTIYSSKKQEKSIVWTVHYFFHPREATAFIDSLKYTRKSPALANSWYNKLYTVHFNCNGKIKSITSTIPRTLLTKSGTQEWKQMRQMVLYNVTTLFICIPATEAVKSVKNSCDKTAPWETQHPITQAKLLGYD